MSIETDVTMAQTLFWDADGIADQTWQERVRQIIRWGLQSRPSGTNASVWHPEELKAKANYELLIANGSLTWLDILKEEVYEAFAEEDPKKLAVELVQVMAVAASWLQDMHLKGEV